MINVKCPNCFADLTVDENRDVLFCEFCGHKVPLNNKKEFTYTYHEVNDAKVKKQEVKEKIELEKIKSDRSILKWIAIIYLFIMVICFLGPEIPNVITSWNVKQYEKNLTGETITITFSSSNLTSEKYNEACEELKNAGFTNVSSIPKKDLGLFEMFDDGKVAEVSIDGITSFKPGNIFSKNAVVVVRYHSMK